MLKATHEEFIAAWQREKNAQRVADALGLTLRSVYERRKRLADRGINLDTLPAAGYESRTPAAYLETGWTFPREVQLAVDTGTVIISSDHHYWPGEPSIAHRALLKAIKLVKPRQCIVNGDIFDGVSLSRHPPFGWSERPGVMDELHVCQERLGDMEQAIPKGCGLYWNIGNHDIRFERTLATNADVFTGLPGLRLADHFPGWDFQWSILINADNPHPVMVKHRYAGGVHAGYNNAMKGGYTIVTGHTHQLEAKPIADFRGRRWGVQCGSLADVDGPQFEYMENNPSFHCSGFAVLTFKDGRLLPPELCEVIDGRAYFRGEVIA